MLRDDGIDDFPTEQTPPAEGGLVHDSTLGVLQRDGHHQAWHRWHIMPRPLSRKGLDSTPALRSSSTEQYHVCEVRGR